MSVLKEYDQILLEKYYDSTMDVISEGIEFPLYDEYKEYTISECENYLSAIVRKKKLTEEDKENLRFIQVKLNELKNNGIKFYDDNQLEEYDYCAIEGYEDFDVDKEGKEFEDELLTLFSESNENKGYQNPIIKDFEDEDLIPYTYWLNNLSNSYLNTISVEEVFFKDLEYLENFHSSDELNSKVFSNYSCREINELMSKFTPVVVAYMLDENCVFTKDENGNSVFINGIEYQLSDNEIGNVSSVRVMLAKYKLPLEIILNTLALVNNYDYRSDMLYDGKFSREYAKALVKSNEEHNVYQKIKEKK